MLKTRLIPVLYIKNWLIVRSENFTIHQNIWNVINEAKRYNDWNIDELIYIDISRKKDYDLWRDDHKIKSYNNIEKIIQNISKICFSPLAFWWWIRTLNDVDLLIKNWADKVVVNTWAFLNPDLITDIWKKYWKQAIILSVDYKVINWLPIVFTNFWSYNTNINIFDWISKYEKLWIWELFINSIDRDGKANWYDIENIKKIYNYTKVPIIACWWVCDEYDFLDLAEEVNISWLAAWNFFHFVENSYGRSKKILKKYNLNFR